MVDDCIEMITHNELDVTENVIYIAHTKNTHLKCHEFIKEF